MQVTSVDRTPNWRPPGTDLNSAGVTRSAPERPANPTTLNLTKPETKPASSVESVSLSAAGLSAASKKLQPDQPLPTAADTEARDWTIQKPEVEKPKQEFPPPEPLYKKLMEHLQSMWRASGNAIDVVDEINKATNPTRSIMDPLVYPDPKQKKVSRTGG